MDSYQTWHPNFPPNLQNCHEEPIRIPGAIQTFGFLLGLDSSDRVVAASENAVKFLPALKDYESRPVYRDQLLRISQTSRLSLNDNGIGRRLVQVQLLGNDPSESYFGAVYRSADLEILEVETARATLTPDTLDYLADMPRMMMDVRQHQNLAGLANFVSEKIRSMTNFDRVMVYEFDEDWNGEVIAESKRSELESYLKLHFPSSDIPQQARALYERNWIRIIPTIHYQPVRLQPQKYQSLDLSDSVLRSVSPIHIEYLKNMGVQASMSISLMVDGKLWGLVACHHYSDHHVPLNIRFGCEAYGQLVSWHIKTLVSGAAMDAVNAGERSLHHALQTFGKISDFTEAATVAERELLELFDCSGIIIRLGSEMVSLGTNPGDVFTTAVSQALVGCSILEPVITHESGLIPALSHLPKNPEVSGFMALALSLKHNYFIVCVRPEVKQSTDWAGNPRQAKRVDFSDPAQRLQPRGSFELWQEIHEGRSLPWRPETVDVFKRFALLFVKIVIERKELVEKSNVELRALNQAKDEFVATVSHELRTPLNAIIGWTELALSGELAEAKFPEALRIIQRNARSQNQLVSDLLDVSRMISGKLKLSVKNMRVSEIVEGVILSFLPAAEAKRIKIISYLDENSDSIIGDPSRVQQVAWNILSNAIKFSPKDSKIWVSVSRVDSQIKMEVRDQGMGIDPQNLEKIFGRFEQVDASFSRSTGGLGLGLSIARHIVELHGGRIAARSEGLRKGASIEAFFPIAPVQPEGADELPVDDRFLPGRAETALRSSRLKGVVVLIAEDEADASRFLDILISAHGAKTFVASNGREALSILEKQCDQISILLSDVGMPEMDGYELIGEVRRSKNKKMNSVCAIALTAFGRPQDRISALKSGFDSYIGKPVMQEELLTVLESVCKSRNR